MNAILPLGAAAAEPFRGSADHTDSVLGNGVPMTKHRMITGFVTVALLAAAATMRSHSPATTRPIASAGIMSFKELTADANKLRTEDFDQSLVYSTKR